MPQLDLALEDPMLMELPSMAAGLSVTACTHWATRSACSRGGSARGGLTL